MIIFTLILGLILGAVGGIFAFRKFLSHKMSKDETIKKGLYSTGYKVGEREITVNAEIKVVKRTKNKVQVEVVSWKEIAIEGAVGNGFTTEKDKKEWGEMISGWYDTESDRISWFEDTLEDHRDKVLKNLLN